MQAMRDLMRSSLARSLRTLSSEDRLAAALPLVCGTAMAAHCQVARLDEDGTLHLRVDEHAWLAPLLGMREVLQHDLQRVAGVQIGGLHFIQPNSAPVRRPSHGVGQPTSGPERPQEAPRFRPGNNRRTP